MKKLLIWQLFVPLLIASGMSFGIAYLLNNRLDYSSVFLNLSTDFMMIVITIWYVDKVLQRHNNENWKEADFAIKYKIYILATYSIETICSPLGIHDTSLPEHELFVSKLRSQRKGGLDMDYYGDFAKKFVAGHFISDPAHDPFTKHFAQERIKQSHMTPEQCTEIFEKLKKFRDEASQITNSYSVRLSANQIKALIDFQFWIERNINSFEDYTTRNEWQNWHQSSFISLYYCLNLLEASSLHWAIEPAG